MEELTEEERRALRGTKFAPLPPPSRTDSSNPEPRLAHPGGPLTTNKAAALARFLERKLSEGNLNLDPDVVERAVRNAQAAINPGKQTAGVSIRHVDSFSDSDDDKVLQETGPSSSSRSETQKRKRKKREREEKVALKKTIHKKKKRKQKTKKQNVSV